MPNPYGQFVPDPLSPSGYRWQRHGEQPATAMLPPVTPHTGGTVRYDEFEDHQLSAVDQDDLSEFDDDPDLEIVQTEKLGPLDEVLLQPPQDPEWQP